MFALSSYLQRNQLFDRCIPRWIPRCLRKYGSCCRHWSRLAINWLVKSTLTSYWFTSDRSNPLRSWYQVDGHHLWTLDSRSRRLVLGQGTTPIDFVSFRIHLLPPNLISLPTRPCVHLSLFTFNVDFSRSFWPLKIFSPLLAHTLCFSLSLEM